ncbi:MAG: hypothetical protein IT206_09895 [Fimbriimonadaceae bacterium]|nr:hypothetical protein [Fimbriimonadaceae bacterium]
MQFRRIYWVVEETRNNDRNLVGVFTSNSDLLERYLALFETNEPDSVRISLIKLDQLGGILGTWESGKFGNLRQDLQKFIDTGEFSIDECDRVSDFLSGR